MTEVTTFRSNHLIDPHLEIWEWQIPAYLFLGGLVAGLMILNGLWRLQGRENEGRAITFFGAIAAPIAMSIGMFFLWLDLANKLNVHQFYMTFEITSPMSWGSWLLLAVYPLMILLLALKGGIETFSGPLAIVNPIWDFVKKIARRYQKQIAVASIVFGGGLGIYTGILLSAFAARPLWNTTLLAPLFLASGLSAASAWGLLSKPSKPEQNFLVRWDIGLLITEAVFIGLILIGLSTGPEAQKEAVKLFFGGNFTAVFWIFVVGTGILLPLWLEVRELRHQPVPVWLGPALALGGSLALRFVFVMAGQVSHIQDITTMTAGIH